MDPETQDSRNGGQTCGLKWGLNEGLNRGLNWTENRAEWADWIGLKIGHNRKQYIIRIFGPFSVHPRKCLVPIQSPIQSTPNSFRATQKSGRMHNRCPPPPEVHQFPPEAHLCFTAHPRQHHFPSRLSSHLYTHMYSLTLLFIHYAPKCSLSMYRISEHGIL